MEKRFSLKDTKGIRLDIPTGYHVLAEATTMAAFNIIVKIKDETTQREYFNMSRTSMNPLPTVAEFFCFDGDDARLFVDIPSSLQIDLRMDSLDFFDAQGGLIMRSYVIICEDWHDADYNDLILHITVMKGKS